MKLIRPIRKQVVTLGDLLPRGDELLHVAYESTAGDPATCPEGVHAGRDPDRPDMAGISKRMVYQSAVDDDLPWFNAHAAAVRANPFLWPPSIRTMVPKGDGGKRPIDDPPEVKRLVALTVRARLQDKMHERFTAGQMGSRPGAACTRRGVTAQDHVGTAIHQAIRRKYTWCVLLDLQDAFGRVPESHAIREFGRMGLDRDAARFLWQMVKINAVLDRQKPPITRKGMGIEQGNPLSASIMDLVLAPVLRRVQARHDVRAFSYLDDIYLMCRTERDAQAAYKTFRAVAEGFGFDNVRDLGDDGKNSKIVDTRTTSIRVLKLYDIDHIGVSPAPEKVAEYLDDLRVAGKQFVPLTMPQVRRSLHCQALTARATRLRTPILISNPPRRSGQDRLPPPSPAAPASKQSSVLIGRGVGDDEDLAKNPNNLVKVPPVEEPDTPTRVRGSFNGVHVPSRHQEDDVHEGDRLRDVLPSGGLSRPPVPGGDPDPGVLPLPLGGDGHHGDGLLRLLDDDGGYACSSQGNQAGCTFLPVEGGSANAEGLRQPRGGDRADDGDRPAPHLLRVHDPAVHEALAAGRGFKFGDNYKGAVLDLTGLGDLGLDQAGLVGVVNGLVKAVRARRRAKTIIDPAESWTTTRAVLGHPGDRVYERVAVEHLPDGRCAVTLLHRRPRNEQAGDGVEDPPRGTDAVLNVRCVNRATGAFELRVVEDGAHRALVVEVDVPSPISGAVAAVAAWVNSRVERCVAVPARGHLAAVAPMLLRARCTSPNVAFGDAVALLLEGRRWSSAGAWAVGWPTGLRAAPKLASPGVLPFPKA